MRVTCGYLASATILNSFQRRLSGGPVTVIGKQLGYSNIKTFNQVNAAIGPTGHQTLIAHTHTHTHIQVTRK